MIIDSSLQDDQIPSFPVEVICRKLLGRHSPNVATISSTSTLWETVAYILCVYVWERIVICLSLNAIADTHVLAICSSTVF